MKLFKISYIIFATIILLISYSCQQDSVIDQPSDLPYLSLPDNTLSQKLNEMSHQDASIIMESFGRMKIRENEYGQYKVLTLSGQEINVSENIYRYITNLIHTQNKNIISEISFSLSSLLDSKED